jgi:N-acetylneuraminic acid mutarotase
MRVSDISEIPADILKTSEVPFLASQQASAPDLQNASALAPQAEGGTWTKKTNMPTARLSLSTVAVNGKIYAMGGTIPPDGKDHTSRLEEYDPVTDKWTKKADMPGERYGLSASAVNGRIYAIGGRHFGVRSTVEEYNPSTDGWAKKADMPTARFSLSTSVVNGKIYAIGGGYTTGALMKEGTDLSFLSTVEEYDPMTDTWTKKADMPTPRIGLCTSVVEGKIYAIGGSHEWHGGNDFTCLSIVEEYDPVTDTWTRKADIPTARGGSAAGVLDGKIYVIGGVNRKTVFVTVEEYDPATDTWIKTAHMPTARAALSASVVSGKIYAIGGATFPVVIFPTVEEYTPE